MLLDLTSLQNRTVNEFNHIDRVSLDEELYKDTDIIDLSPIDYSVSIHRVTDSSYDMELSIKGVMALPCSITLDKVEYPFDIKTNVKLSNDDVIDEEYVKINQNHIDIISILWQNIVLEIPLKVVSESAHDKELSGEGWKLIRED